MSNIYVTYVASMTVNVGFRKPRYVADTQHATPPSQSRGEQYTHGENIHYAPYPSGARPVLHNPRTSQPEIVQAPVNCLFPKTEVSQPENATPIPHQAYDPQPSGHVRNAQRKSDDRGSKYYANTHHGGGVVVEPAVSRRPDPPAVPSSTVQASTNNTYSDTTKVTGSYLSELGQDFVKLTHGDYGACQEFMNRYPEILDENRDNFQQEALRLQRNGKTSQVRNCVQQLLLLRTTFKMSNNERRTFFNKMKDKDPKTLRGFLLDFDKIYDALKLAGAKQPKPTQAVKDKSEPESVNSGDRRYGQAPAGIAHPPEATRHRSNDERMSTSIDKLNINPHNQQDPARSYGAGGNGTRAPPATYRSSNGRRPTLPSVDENRRPNFSNNKAQGAPPSVVDYDIRGDGEKQEELDHRYYVRPDGGKFFKVGRVFAMLWHESAGDPKGGHLSNKEQFQPYRAGRYGERVHSHILRMVVVKERHGYCWCIPIHTYNGRGVMKSGFNQQDQRAHAIIHMDDTEPDSTSEEEMRLMTKNPIAVRAESSDQKLHIMSRLNFGTPYTIQMNVKVMNVGTITQGSMSAFESYWRNECGGD
jgi:hypothetical protein